MSHENNSATQEFRCEKIKYVHSAQHTHTAHEHACNTWYLQNVLVKEVLTLTKSSFKSDLKLPEFSFR